MTEPKTSAEDRALRRIQGLLNQAEDAAATEAERETSLATAMRLMAEYGVTEAMASVRKQTREEIVQKTIGIRNPYAWEKKELAGHISLALNCRYMFTHYRGIPESITIMGYQNDVARVEMLYTSLLLQATHGVIQARPYGWATAAETRSYRKSWLAGFTNRVFNRLHAAERRAARQYEQEHTRSGTALVLANRTTQVKAYYDKHFGDLKIGKKRPLADPDGLSAGERAGRTADIGDAKLDNGDQRKIEASR